MTRQYVYGLLAAGAGIAAPGLGAGLGGQPVERIAGAAIAALVSAGVAEPLAGTRRNMLAHTAVLERAMVGNALLPLRFGTVAPDRATLIAGLDADAAALRRELAQIEGRIELGVKAFWQDGAPPAGALQAGPMPADPALSRASVAQEIDAALAPLAERRVELRLRDDSMILNHAFLVPRYAEPAFDIAMERLTARFGALVSFRYVGPVPPCNFVDVRADWLVRC